MRSIMRLAFLLLLGNISASIYYVRSGLQNAGAPIVTGFAFSAEGHRVALLSVPSFSDTPEPSEVCLSRSRVGGDVSIRLKASETAHIIYMRGNGSLGSLAPGEMEECQSAGCITHVRIVETVNGGVEWEELGPVLALTPETFQYDQQSPAILGSETMAVVSCVIAWDEASPQGGAIVALEQLSELGLWAVSDAVALRQKPSDATRVQSRPKPARDFASRITLGSCVTLVRPFEEFEGLVGPFEVRDSKWIKSTKILLLHDVTMDRSIAVETPNVQPCNLEETFLLAETRVNRKRMASMNSRASEGAGLTVFRKGDYVVTKTLDPKHPQLLRALKIYDWDGSSGPYYMYDPVSGYVHVAPADEIRPCHPSEIPEIVIDEEKRLFVQGDKVGIEPTKEPQRFATCWGRRLMKTRYTVVRPVGHDRYKLRSEQGNKDIKAEREDLVLVSEAATREYPASGTMGSTAEKAGDGATLIVHKAGVDVKGPSSFQLGDYVMQQGEYKGHEELTGPFRIVHFITKTQNYVVSDPTNSALHWIEKNELRRCTDDEISKIRTKMPLIQRGGYVRVVSERHKALDGQELNDRYVVRGFASPHKCCLSKEGGKRFNLHIKHLRLWEEPKCSDSDPVPSTSHLLPNVAYSAAEIPTTGEKRKPEEAVKQPPLKLPKIDKAEGDGSLQPRQFKPNDRVWAIDSPSGKKLGPYKVISYQIFGKKYLVGDPATNTQHTFAPDQLYHDDSHEDASSVTQDD